ncbi:hypothetical protein ACIBG4_40825 [Nonomuraea sp. NPDC050383]|uniref:hypothetical protein n=1 Tax=Nonomuraea sp. NPDC050383 TaxID=3364362 RepID=UPI0037A632C5
MARTNVYRFDEYDGRILEGWFDPEKAERFEEATRWDGNNHVSLVAGGQFEHEALYRTTSGRWVLKHWSQWQGRETTHEFISSDRARQWLLTCEHDDVVEKHFGELEEESGPGRPKIGEPINIRLGEDLQTRVDAAALPGEKRAATVRRLLEKALA